MSVDTPEWVRDAVFYQIFPDRFAASERLPKPGWLEPWDAPPTTHGFKGGDLLGVAERVPYLADLGINAIYLTPIFASASNHRYHTYDYFAVDPLLGGEAALRELVDTAHRAGMRVVLDGVFNHVGRGFWAFHHVLENGLDSPYRSWFHLDEGALARGVPIDAYPDAHDRARILADEAAPGRDPVRPMIHGGDGSSLGRLGYQAWWDLPPLPKLNTDEPRVRDHLFAAAEHWLRFGIDGWRLDVPEEIADGAFWAEFRRRCRAVNPEAYLVGEIWRVAPEWLDGDRFDALMNYPLAEAILGFTAADHLDRAVVEAHHEYGRRVRRLDGAAFGARVMDLAAAYDPAVVSAQLNLLDSHDTPRFLTMSGGDRDSYRLAVFLQATLPGAPCVYYGDEVGLEGGNDPASRGAFPWERPSRDAGLHAFVRGALAMRHAEPILRRGTLRVIGASGDAVVFERTAADATLLVAINAGGQPVRIALDTVAEDGHRSGPDPGSRIGDEAGWEAAGPAAVIRFEGWDDASIRRGPTGDWTHVGLGPRSGAVLRR